jgi:F0F1-type ATP synthase epsilon subunit
MTNVSESSPAYLTIYIRDKNKTSFKGQGFSVTSTNEKGVFDILPEHANFISLIKDFVTIDKGNPKEKKMLIYGGVLKVASDKVDIFLNV